MNDSRLSNSIKRWAAAGNNSAAGAKLKACGMALFARSLDPAAVSALAAILGSFAGAFASARSAWITHGHRDRREPCQEDRLSRATVFRRYQRERASDGRCNTAEIRSPQQPHTDLGTHQSHSAEHHHERCGERGTRLLNHPCYLFGPERYRGADSVGRVNWATSVGVNSNH
jgi:hypothetical protein